MNLCRQLEVQLVTEKLTHAISQAQARICFGEIRSAPIRRVACEKDSLEDPETTQVSVKSSENRRYVPLRTPSPIPQLPVHKFAPDAIGEYDIAQRTNAIVEN